ncbi:MAG: amino acid ABC transporter permease [Oscillospiraceae bacterium]|nr:amino acid ABC transporter permease [Oscillospiraceae bacterium]
MDLTLLREQMPVVIQALNTGFLQTLKLFFVTLAGALPLGLLISFGSMNNFRPFSFLLHRRGEAKGFVRWLGNARPIRAFFRFIIWVVRGTPLMIQLLIIFFFPGMVLHNNWWGSGEAGRFAASAVAFIFNYACYFSEIYRGGIQSVPKGQQEAGQVLGMTKRQIFFRVTLLQMVTRIVPPMSNEIITLVKDTSLARIIALQEIIWAGQAFMKGSQGIAGAIWPLFFTAVYYLVFNGVVTVLLGRLEKKLDFFR